VGRSLSRTAAFGAAVGLALAAALCWKPPLPRGVSPRDAAAPALPSSPALEYSAPSERMLGVTY